MDFRYYIILTTAIFFSFASTAQSDAVLFVIDGKDTVTANEFQYVYNKSNLTAGKQSVEEYLELYKNFKLKVFDAKANGYENQVSYKNEVAGFSTDLASSYWDDNILVKPLATEIISRSKIDVEFSNIFIPVKSQDSLGSFSKIQSAYKELQRNVPFDKVASTYSSLSNSYMGYYSSFQIPGIYRLENALYNTPVGSYSQPIRTDYGYHIVKVYDRRPALGNVELAQILIRADEQNKDLKKVVIDKIYEELQSGRKFATIARQYSEDSKTKAKGGYLGFGTVGKYENDFEKEIYSLTADKSYSKPFYSSRGWHIINRISKEEPYKTADAQRLLETRIKKDSRYQVRKNTLLSERYPASEVNRQVVMDYIAQMSSVHLETFWKSDVDTDLSSVVILNAGTSSFNMGDFLSYMAKNKTYRARNKKSKTPQQVGIELYNMFKAEVLESEYINNLTAFSADFRNLLQEYEEGILLFNVSKDMVWDKSTTDTIGLNQFYESNKDSYRYQNRAVVHRIDVDASETKAITKFSKLLALKALSKIQTKFKDKPVSFFEPEYIEEDAFAKKYPDLKFKKGDVVKEISEDNTSVSFYKVQEIVKSSFKPLNEVRGFVISDYQKVLEEKWLTELKAKYPIVLNQKVLKAIK